MKLDYLLFDRTFPTYSDYRVPMWASWNSNDKSGILEVVIPGFKKEDFKLYEQEGILFLEVKNGEKNDHYSLLERLCAEKFKISEALAEYNGGVLKVIIPRKKIKRTEIEVS